jgi:hypothetical protein
LLFGIWVKRSATEYHTVVLDHRVEINIPLDFSAAPGSLSSVTGYMDVSYVYTVTRIYETPRRRWGIRRGVR